MAIQTPNARSIHGDGGSGSATVLISTVGVGAACAGVSTIATLSVAFAVIGASEGWSGISTYQSENNAKVLVIDVLSDAEI